MRFVGIVFGLTLLPAFASAQTLFEERFENANFASRGWIDNTTLSLSTVEHIPGSVSSLEYRWQVGATNPTNGGSARHLFTATDTVYFSYWLKYSANWVGQNQVSFGHHEFYVHTDQDGDFAGLARSHLTAYIEENLGVGQLALQDALNINEGNINVDLRGVTENRAVAGCNGTYPDGYSAFSCYVDGIGPHNNVKLWQTSVVFNSTPGSMHYKNAWHHIEVVLNMNTIVGGIAQANGVMQYWYDGQLLINSQNVVYRTGQHPTMRWHSFIMAPYMGQGSPVDQSMWIDDLVVATARPTTVPAAPTNLRVLQ